MRKSVLLLVFITLLVGSCQKQDSSIYQPSSRIGEVFGNNFKIEMYMFPSPDTLRKDDTISLKFLAINSGKDSVSGKIQVADTPETSQLGGIQEPAQADFTVKGSADGRNTIDEVIIPEARNIVYSGDVNLTKFIASIDYNIESETVSDKFCLKYYANEGVKNCNFKGTVKTMGPSLITGFDYEYYDSDDDNIIDRLTLKFELNEKCNIAETEGELIQNTQVFLKSTGTNFNCNIDKQSSNEKRKTIKCVNSDVLAISTKTHYEESIVARFKYNCGLTIKSSFINLNKGG